MTTVWVLLCVAGFFLVAFAAEFTVWCYDERRLRRAAQAQNKKGGAW